MYIRSVLIVSLMFLAANLTAISADTLPCPVPAEYLKPAYDAPTKVIFSLRAFKFCEQLTGSDDQLAILKTYLSRAYFAIWSEYRLGKGEYKFIEIDQQAAFQAELLQQNIAYKSALIETVTSITRNKEYNALFMKLAEKAYESLVEIHAYRNKSLNICFNEVYATLTKGSTLKNCRMMPVIMGFLRECLVIIEDVEHYRTYRGRGELWKKACKLFQPISISEYNTGGEKKIKFSDKIKFKTIELLGRLLEKIFPAPKSNTKCDY